MIRHMALFTLTLFTLALSGGHPAMAVDPLFDELAGRSYVIVLTGPVDDDAYIEQVEAFRKYVPQLNERNVIVLHFEDRVLEPLPELSAFAYKTDIIKEKDEHRYLQSKLHTDDDVFSVVLVGIDGVYMQVWPDVVRPEYVLEQIDEDRAALREQE